MEEWTTPKKVSTAMLIMGFAAFPQILSVSKNDWSPALDIAVACFSIGIPLSAGYFLREAKMESPHGNWSRNLHDVGWVISVSITIGGIWAMFHHLGVENGTSFGGSIILAVLLILVGAHADRDWGHGKKPPEHE